MGKRVPNYESGNIVENNHVNGCSDPDNESEVAGLAQTAYNQLLEMIRAGEHKAALKHLMLFFETAHRWRPKIVDRPQPLPLATFVAEVGHLCKGTTQKLVIRTSGDDPPALWHQFNDTAQDINRSIKKKASISGLNGRPVALSDMPIDEAAEVIERMIMSATHSRVQLKSTLRG